MVVGVTFDVFGTLFDWRGIGGIVSSVLREIGVEVSSDEFIEVWRNRQRFYMQVNTLLGVGHVSFGEITRRALLYTAKRYGIELRADHVDRLVNSWDEIEPFPEVKICVRRIKEHGFRIAPLSNGDIVQLRKLIDKLGIEFDDVFSAELVGVYKPHPRIYEQACTKWNVKPSKIMHVAASAYDVAGSKTYGMVATWVNRTSEIYDEFEAKPDYIVKNFNELLRILNIE